MPTATAVAAPAEDPGRIPKRVTTPPYPQPLGKLVPCRKCRQPVRFVVTARGAWCPVDAEPVIADWQGCYDDRQLPERGAVVFTGPDTVYHLRPTDRVYVGQDVYLSHFASCPFAKEFRS